MKNALIITIAMLSILAVSMVPQAFSFCIPPNPASDDQKFEVFGPHINGIKIFVYSSVATEFLGMDNGEIDIVDWAVDSAHAGVWALANGPITEQNYGGEAGYYLIDINNNATLTDDDAHAGIYNPTSEIHLRQAIAACVNRSNVVDFTGGFALPMYTLVPNWMGSYINPDIAPGQGLEALTYGGYKGDLVLANAYLDAGGYTWNGGHTKRIDPHTGHELNLIFYSRGGDRQLLGDDLNINLNAVGIGTEYHSGVARATVTGPVFAQEYYNLYTGGWTGIGPDPDFLCDLYNGSNYYHPGSPPNYLAVNYPETNHNATTIKLAPNAAVGLAATLDFQYWFAYYAAAVPVFCYSGVKAYKNVPHETSTSMSPVTYPPTGDWKHLVNQLGIGVNSWWSTLDMQTYGNLYPNLNAWYGFSSTVTLQNIVYAQWYWDMEVLGRIYDGGWARNPYTLQWTVPQLYEDYSVGTWTDPVTHETKTSVTVTLRQDAKWADGHPVTVADVYYTLVEISKDLLAKHFPPPWWYPTVQYMRSVEIIDDFKIQVLLDVQSFWAAGWVIGSVIIPKHIWKPIVDASINDQVHNYVQGTTPDANIIGTGPFRWVSGTGITVGDTIVMVANSPGSVVNGITSPGYYQYCPVKVRIVPTGKITITPSVPWIVIPVTFQLSNLWTDGNLTVNKYVYVGTNRAQVEAENASLLLPGYPVDVNLATVTPYPMGTSENETISLNMTRKTTYWIKVAVHIKGPASITYTEQWKSISLNIAQNTNITWTAGTKVVYIDGYDGMAPGTKIIYDVNHTMNFTLSGAKVEYCNASNMVTYTIPNPWISQWINTTCPLFVTIAQDIGGTTLYDLLGVPYSGYPAYLKNEAPAPDMKVDIKDISLAAKAFGTIPGSPAWNTVADLNGDFKIDIKDIASIAKQFGY
jgi:ABC-type transport system substrate-binding protein